MGYRSDVCLRVEPHVVEVIDAAKMMCDDLRAAFANAVINGNSNCTDFRWDSVKWYDGYKDVDAVMSLLHSLPDEDYGMIRIGEEVGDVEYYGEPSEFDMYVNQCIEW